MFHDLFNYPLRLPFASVAIPPGDRIGGPQNHEGHQLWITADKDFLVDSCAYSKPKPGHIDDAALPRIGIAAIRPVFCVRRSVIPAVGGKAADIILWRSDGRILNSHPQSIII